MKVAQSCLTLCYPMDCILSGSSVHGILQARLLEWLAIPFSRGSSLLKGIFPTRGLIFIILMTEHYIPYLYNLCTKYRNMIWKQVGWNIREGNGNPLQYSCLENPRDRGACWTAIYGVAQSWTRLTWLSSSSSSRMEHLRKIALHLRIA